MRYDKILLMIREASKKIPWDKVAEYGPIVIAKSKDIYGQWKSRKKLETEYSRGPENNNPIYEMNRKLDDLFLRINTVVESQTKDIELLNNLSSNVVELTNWFKVLASRVTLAIILSVIALAVGVISIVLVLLRT